MTAPCRGLSLVECLVVIAILAILVGLMLPATRRVSGASHRTTCMNNLRQLGLALNNYEAQHKRLPPGCIGPSSADPADRLAWTVALLPYLEQEAVAVKLDPADGYTRNAAVKEPIKVFRCPSAKGIVPEPLTHYVGCGGSGADSPSWPVDRPGIGLFGFDRQLRFSNVTDGLSNTIALLETHDRPGPWAQGGFATVRGIEPMMARTGGHKGGISVGLGDGSVRFVLEDIPFSGLAAYATIAGGEPVIDLD